jgi:hypothetical protein
MSDVIACPDPTCQAPARIVDRWTSGSRDGPVEHVETGCGRGHWGAPTVGWLHLQAGQAEPPSGEHETARPAARALRTGRLITITGR